MRLMLLLCMSTAMLMGQAGVQQPIPFFDLKQYLGLSDDQFAKLMQNISDYGQVVNTRQQRMFQVQSEIRDETGKSPLDPLALGLRYAEVETICRNIREEANGLMDRNKAILTDAQKVKLKALEDAYKLFPLISQAQSASLLSLGTGFSQWFNTPIFVGGTVSAGILSPTPFINGCQQTLNVPTAVLRAGD